MTRRPSLPRSTPSEQGVPAAAIRDFLGAIERTGQEVHSLMLLRHGHVVAEGWWAPFSADLPHELYSISKSFTATAVGLAIEAGLFGLDDTVVSLLPDDAPDQVDPHLAALRVRHLLSMSTGHAEDTIGVLGTTGDNWARAILAAPIVHEPGTTFVYNSGASYLLSAIVQRTTGQRLLDYLTPRLLEPLGILDATWATCPRGIDTGGWGLSLTTEDVATFGQLLLRSGIWEGRELIPGDWVDAATSSQVSNGDPALPDDGTQGYGYQFWICRHGAYRADGAFGQLAIVMPEQDAVLVLTGGMTDTAPVMNAVWEHLLGPMSSMGPLPEHVGEGATAAIDADEDAAHRALLSSLAGLALPHPSTAVDDETARRVSGRRFVFPRNVAHLASARIDVTDDGATLTLGDAAGDHAVECGAAGWIVGSAPYPENGRYPAARSAPVAAACGWTGDGTFLARLQFHETPFALTFTFTFEGETATLEVTQNVSFGPTTLVRTVGVAGG